MRINAAMFQQPRPVITHFVVSSVMPDGIASEVAAPTMFLDDGDIAGCELRVRKNRHVHAVGVGYENFNAGVGLVHRDLVAGALSVVLAPRGNDDGGFQLVAPASVYRDAAPRPALPTIDSPTTCNS